MHGLDRWPVDRTFSRPPGDLQIVGLGRIVRWMHARAGFVRRMH